MVLGLVNVALMLSDLEILEPAMLSDSIWSATLPVALVTLRVTGRASESTLSPASNKGRRQYKLAV